MDDEFRREVSEVVAALAKSQQEKLAAAGTFVDIEELTAEVGDEVARQLANYTDRVMKLRYFVLACGGRTVKRLGTALFQG